MDEMHVDGCRLVPATTAELLGVARDLASKRYADWMQALRYADRPIREAAREAYNRACEFQEAASIAHARDKPDEAVEGGRCPTCLAEIVALWRSLGYSPEVAREEAIHECEVLTLLEARKAEPESGLAAVDACLYCGRCGSEWEV